MGLTVALPAARAADHVWLIGGGAHLESSQAQIELNVIWELKSAEVAGGKSARVQHTL
jgi:hypothetical protein